MKTSFTAAPGSRPRLFAVSISFAMALIAYMPAAACALPGGAAETTDPAIEAPTSGTPFDRQGMWIWYVEQSDGGDLDRIVSRADRTGIGTLYVKSGDAGHYWSQFSSSLVDALHSGDLDVCAWQFVYGDSPVAEAKVDYHPAFPYSVFLGSGGATFNQPQMYWKAIGTSVRSVYEHTYLFNRLWGHPIYPIGQTYDNPGPGQILRFRRFAASIGGQAPSWWDWQETSSAGWRVLGATNAGPLGGYRPIVEHPLLRRGSRGDLVVWAQEHLVGAGAATLPVTGLYGKQTYAAVRSFQVSHGLLADGAIGTTTWASLLGVEPARPRWAARRARTGAGASRVWPAKRPASASLPAHAYEIDPGPAP